MSKVIITCPNSALKKKERIDQLFANCKEWIYSEPLLNLIQLFDDRDEMRDYGRDFYKDIKCLYEFARRWDFRRGKERWDVADDSFIKKNEKKILDSAYELDLCDHISPHQNPDFILPLGGARRANLVRPLMAKNIIDDFDWVDKKIVALAGMRPISKIERPYLNEYAQDSLTEYEAICAGLERAFGVLTYKEKFQEHENQNLQSAIRMYESTENNQIFCLAAPSSDPTVRRANSHDTFRFFIETFGLKKGNRVLLISSCIYVPFQLLRFMKIAIENEIEVDCIGADPMDEYSLKKTSNYLQEIKSTIDAIMDLAINYQSRYFV